MVRIRLRRVGAKKQPHYRIVVADQRSPRDGRHIETIGHYNPRTDPETVSIKEDRALYWLSVGAQPSDVVRHMLEKQGTTARLARLKAGEELEALVAEYEASIAAQAGAEPVDDKPVKQAAAVKAPPVEEDVPEFPDSAIEAEAEAPESAEEETDTVDERDEPAPEEG